MGDSVQKACSFITALALSVIAVQLIPFSRDKELSNYCREYLALLKIRPDKEIAQKIIDNFDKEIYNFIQVCPKEMINKLENPIKDKINIKKVS